MQTLNKGLGKLFSNGILLVLIAFVTSCGTNKNMIYFENLADTSLSNTSRPPEPAIQSNDLLAISISSLNAEADRVFNPQSATAGYLVDADGNIQIPLLGNIRAAGLTKSQLKTNITKSLTDRALLKEPTVRIQYLNFKVTVLGEVGQPSVITVPSEKITILEALGTAGDLTFSGKRDNILLIREENGKKVFRRLNLNSPAIFSSQYYYLMPNDVLYIEPNKTKLASNSSAARVVPAVLSALTFAIGVATLFIK